MMKLVDGLVSDPYIAKLFDTPAEISSMVEVESALARAQESAGFITSDAAKHIQTLCANFVPNIEEITKAMQRDGVAVPELVRQLRMNADEKFVKFVHLGATSQDIIDTGLMLRLAKVFEHLIKLLDNLTNSLDKLLEKYSDKPYIAHTRMQIALPMTVQNKIDTWYDAIHNHKSRFMLILDRVLTVQTGGAIGNNADFGEYAPLINANLAKELKLMPGNSWHTDRSRIMDIAQALCLLTGTLGKVGQDIALMSQNEVHAIHVASGGTSSAMAHKNNPVKAEVLVSIARFQAGLLGTIAQSMVHENERSGAAWTLEWMVLPQMAITAGGAIKQAHDILDTATF